jgi:hypothetical protein
VAFWLNCVGEIEGEDASRRLIYVGGDCSYVGRHTDGGFALQFVEKEREFETWDMYIDDNNVV